MMGVQWISPVAMAPLKGTLFEKSKQKKQHTLYVHSTRIVQSTVAKNTKRTEVPNPLPAPM